MSSENLPKIMRAVIHDQAKQTLSFTDKAPLPVLENGEYLLKVHSAAITNGELDWPRPEKYIVSVPGVEMAGEVVSSPSSTSKFKPGDKIYMRTTYPTPGSARDFTTATEKVLAMKPSNISADGAAAVPVSGITAWQALFVQAGLKPDFEGSAKSLDGQQYRVLVNGASGGAGLWMCQLAHAAGCYVVGVCSGKNAQLVKDHGADEILDYKKTSILDWIEQDPSRKVDLVLDCVTWNGGDAWQTLKEHGQLFSIVPRPDMVWQWDLDRPAGISETIKGKYFIMEAKAEDLERITTLIESGKARPVVDSVYPLEDYRAAFDKVASGRAVGKVVLKVADDQKTHISSKLI